MSKDAAERLVEAINSATGLKMSVVGSGYNFKVVDERGREMVGAGWMRAEELLHRVEAVLYFVQRGGRETENEGAGEPKEEGA